MLDLEELFEKHSNAEFLNFDRVKKPLHERPDLAVFLLLAKLVPGKADIVSSAKHDEIWLSVEPDELARVATEADIVTLIRCGLRYDDDSLKMFV